MRSRLESSRLGAHATSFLPETADDSLVEASLRRALCIDASSDLAVLRSSVRLSHAAPDSALSIDDGAREIHVVICGRVLVETADHTQALGTYDADQVLPPRLAGLVCRALRAVVLAHVPFDALDAVSELGASRAFYVASGARDQPLPDRRVLIGLSGNDHALTREIGGALADALRRHGTVASLDVDASGPALPTRLALARAIPPATFQIAAFPPPRSPGEIPHVDRWLFVTNGASPGEGRPMPRGRTSGFARAASSTSAAVPHPSGTRRAVVAGEPGLAPRTLIVVHDRSLRVPRDTERHLAFHRPDDHRHVRRGYPPDFARLAREIAGVAVGFALGAGGARGLAHLGVVRAAEEEAVPIDYLSGTSVGAVVGAIQGLGCDANERRSLAERLVSARPFSEFTLPTTALLGGRRFEMLASELFGTMDLADLWVPLVTATCDLGNFEEIVHRRGPLAQILLAGCVLPGILPPRVLDRKIHVDGGTSNMLPVALLRSHTTGPLVAVDVSPWESIVAPFDAYPVGARALLARLRGKPAPLSALQVFWRAVSFYTAKRARVESALANVTITPDLSGVGVSDLEAYREIELAGYVAAKAAFASVTFPHA